MALNLLSVHCFYSSAHRFLHLLSFLRPGQPHLHSMGLCDSLWPSMRSPQLNLVNFSAVKCLLPSARCLHEAGIAERSTRSDGVFLVAHTCHSVETSVCVFLSLSQPFSSLSCWENISAGGRLILFHCHAQGSAKTYNETKASWASGFRTVGIGFTRSWWLAAAHSVQKTWCLGRGSISFVIEITVEFCTRNIERHISLICCNTHTACLSYGCTRHTLPYC